MHSIQERKANVSLRYTHSSYGKRKANGQVHSEGFCFFCNVGPQTLLQNPSISCHKVVLQNSTLLLQQTGFCSSSCEDGQPVQNGLESVDSLNQGLKKVKCPIHFNKVTQKPKIIPM